MPIDRLAAFYKKYYQPDNAVLVIAGQFDEVEGAGVWWRRPVGAIPRPTRKLDATYTVEPAQDGERYVELRRVGQNPGDHDRRGMRRRCRIRIPRRSKCWAGSCRGGGRGGGGPGRLYKALVDNKKALSARMGYEELHDPGLRHGLGDV